ncbi:MAG: ABC transporter ATP-binding protein [Acidobacteriota bacterium]
MIEVADVHCYYGRIHALKGVSLRIERGEIACLIGANGAGKSTTLMALSGIVPIASGRVTFDGADITGMPPDAIVAKGLCQVPEGRRIFPRLTVEENLEMGAFLRRNAAEIASDMDRVFTLFPRLKERRRQVGGTLSGGEQQMLAIGRALMARPRLLLLDEPSLGLSPILVASIFEIIVTIAKGGTTVFLVEQNAHMALEIARRGYVMETGKIVIEDDARKLLADPRVQEAYLGG